MRFAVIYLGQQMTVKQTRKVADAVEKKTADGKCLKCESKSDTTTRGLCPTCYGRFVTERKALSEHQRPHYEAALIEQGLLLPARPGKPRPDDEFSQAAQAVIGTK
jgi:hypothetical protein